LGFLNRINILSGEFFMKKNQLRINGYKEILKGELVNDEKFPLHDTIVYKRIYEVNGKTWILYGTDLQVIGYTDRIPLINRLDKLKGIATYRLFWLLSGRK
jgi:hypothetical protein